MNTSPALLALTLALVACDRLKPAEERTVQRWLLCEESVRANRIPGLLSPSARVSSEGAKEALKEGPSKSG